MRSSKAAVHEAEGRPAHKAAIVVLPARGSRWAHFWRQGMPAIWTTGFMVLLLLALLGGMMGIIVVRGVSHFWPGALVQIETPDGSFLGRVRDAERIPKTDGVAQERLQLWIGNRDLYGLDFRWFEVADITARRKPRDAVVVEREEHGNFHGFLRQVRVGAQVASGEAAWPVLGHETQAAARERQRVRELERRYESVRKPVTRGEAQLAKARRQSQAAGAPSADEVVRLEKSLETAQQSSAQELERLNQERDAIATELRGHVAMFETADGLEKEIELQEIVRAYRPNEMTALKKLGFFSVKVGEFIGTQPRESNTEGGVLPAIFGTVLMVLLMTIAVVPLGVLTALYLHEYARDGFVLRAVRLAVSNLAGVPSIVFGMFGLAFFVYGVGGALDRWLFSDTLPSPTFGTGGILWASLTLALLTLPVVVVASEEGLAAVPRANREASLALGATKWQTLWHVVLPQAVPGILTGVILAIGRAAGEVAPLMLTGVVKLAPALALDGEAPFVHLERKFMHLGFHIYDVSMQSPNVEAAKPMVYATTLLLLVLVVALNTTAIVVRNRMRLRYRGAAV